MDRCTLVPGAAMRARIAVFARRMLRYLRPFRPYVINKYVEGVAFEPNPANVDAIRKNIRLNRLANVSIEVQMVTLDSYIGMRPTCLKLDVEGYERDTAC